jgi:hypothetical protein
VIGRDTPVEKDRRPPPPSPRTTLTRSATTRITCSPFRPPRGHREQRDDLLAEASHRHGDVARPDRLHPGADEPLLKGPNLVGSREVVCIVLVGLGHDDDHRPVDVPTEGVRVLDASPGVPARRPGRRAGTRRGTCPRPRPPPAPWSPRGRPRSRPAQACGCRLGSVRAPGQKAASSPWSEGARGDPDQGAGGVVPGRGAVGGDPDPDGLGLDDAGARCGRSRGGHGSPPGPRARGRRWRARDHRWWSRAPRHRRTRRRRHTRRAESRRRARRARGCGAPRPRARAGRPGGRRPARGPGRARPGPAGGCRWTMARSVRLAADRCQQ